MSTAIAAAAPVVFHAHIWLAENEWTSELMREVAEEYFRSHPDLTPLEVEVVEHAGWCLTFTRDGSIVYTANDMAQLSTDARNWNKKYYHSPRKWVESIRRERAACKRCGNTREVVGGGICQRCKFPDA